MKFAFFGTDKFSVGVLNKLLEADLKPDLIITAVDKPSGRGHKITSSPVKIWADEKEIPTLQPTVLDEDFRVELQKISGEGWDVFALASYGKIIPDKVLKMPKHGMLNVHPSLLPQYRGASPIESAVLDDNKDTGVTIMLVDKEMDHGPILEQEYVHFDEWKVIEVIEKKLAEIGGKMLSKTMPLWCGGGIEEQEQDHDQATFTKKIQKEDGEIESEDLKKLIDFGLEKTKQNLKPEKQRQIFLKVMALNDWPGAYFFIKHKDTDLRVKITQAKWENNNIVIEEVIPAGRKPMTWKSFVDGFIRN